MSSGSHILCPTCGREILAPGTPESDHGRCTCAAKNDASNDASGDASGDAPSPNDGDLARQSRKSCYVCGADLAGQRRYKDRNGKYWCATCRAAEAQQKTSAKVNSCDDCGRSFDPRKLTDFRDIKLCSSCLAERSSKLKQRAKKEFTPKTFKQHEWGTVLKLLAAAIALSSLAYFGWTHSHH